MEKSKKTTNQKQKVSQKELQKKLKEKDEQIIALKQQLKDAKMDILLEFKFSSIENLKQNLEVFDSDLKRKRESEEQKQKELMIENLDIRGIENFFVPQESIQSNTPKQEISHETQNYIDILAQRFED